MAQLYLTLIHHPVLDRRGKTVTSAITSLDIHDLARAARTYGAAGVFVVHPVGEQRDFAARLLDHWRLGHGREFDSRRREALELIRVVAELDDAIAAIADSTGTRPLMVYTSARAQDGMSFAELRQRLDASGAAPILILLGTGFGMAPEVKDRADLVLAPIRGPGDYNHLSVRSAASIILDRLRGALMAALHFRAAAIYLREVAQICDDRRTSWRTARPSIRSTWRGSSSTAAF